MERLNFSCERSELTHSMVKRLIEGPGYHYAWTLSDNEKGLETTIQDLDFSRETMEQYVIQFLGLPDFKILSWAYEAKPRTGHLHLHCYVVCSKPLKYKDLKVKGQQNYFRMLVGKRNRNVWLTYMAKSTKERAEAHRWATMMTRPDAPCFFI